MDTKIERPLKALTPEPEQLDARALGLWLIAGQPEPPDAIVSAPRAADEPPANAELEIKPTSKP